VVREADERREFHGAAEMDQIDLLAARGVVAPGDVQELGGDAQAAPRRTQIAPCRRGRRS
jgi:hypothetical protein